jgi:hypothetical protein
MHFNLSMMPAARLPARRVQPHCLEHQRQTGLAVGNTIIGHMAAVAES